jgi:hypothetical protein
MICRAGYRFGQVRRGSKPPAVSTKTPAIKWEDLVMSGTNLLCSLIGVSLALAIGASTDTYAQTTALRGARVIDGLSSVTDTSA